MDNKIYYDLHIHTALSPCGSNDMTPNNIVNMAAISELDCIAVTDHNTAGNVRAVMKAAENNGLDLIVIPGMELETAEEVHVVCLFPELDALLGFEAFVAQRLPVVKNKKEIFGEELYLNEDDEITGENDNLLLVAADIGIYEAVAKAGEFGGIAIPAHIDRPSYSILSNLGFLPADIGVNLVELSKACDPEVFLIEHKRQLMRDAAYIQSSDAHYLENISGRERYLRIEGGKNARAVITALKNKR